MKGLGVALALTLAIAPQTQAANLSQGSSALRDSMMKGMQSMRAMSMTGDTDQDFAPF